MGFSVLITGRLQKGIMTQLIKGKNQENEIRRLTRFFLPLHCTRQRQAAAFGQPTWDWTADFLQIGFRTQVR
jgi:hypothetical protein